METKRRRRGGGGGVSLPEDIIFDVLAWLPVRPLCRFRCMSKGWRAIISDPAFAAAQKSRAAPLLVDAFLVPDEQPKKHNPYGYTPELRVMDTDGDVLRVVRDVEGRLLPTRLDLVCVDKSRSGASIVDPARGGGPEVIRLSGEALPFDSPGQLCEVATLGSGVAEPKWREAPAGPIRACWCTGCTATVNGVVYLWSLFAHAHPGKNHIAAFDLESEGWKTTIHGPAIDPKRPGERWHTALGELKGALSMVKIVQFHRHDPHTITDIWMLVDSEKSVWVKAYVIQSPKCWYVVKPLDVLRDGRLLLLRTVDKRAAKGHPHPTENKYILQLYDSTTGAFTDLMDMPKGSQVTLPFARGQC
ncbi:hypothetical protein ACP70R_044075 [Stipagrostis hirtigluma subsp. patula]